MSGRRHRPRAAPNRGIGKELPRDDLAEPIPDQPLNRRQRRAKAAWERRAARLKTQETHRG